MSLREKQKNARRQRILDAAEQLIRETGGTDFSVRVLAAAAEVSFATPFNLFGSKEGLLYALLSRSLDKFVADGLTFKSANRCYHVVEAAKSAVDIFVYDPDFLRPLYRVLLGVRHPVHRPLFMRRTFAYWKTAALTIPDSRKLRDPRTQDLIAHALMAHFIGLLELWVQEDMNDSEFQAHAICGVILNVYAVVDERHRLTMQRWLNAAQAQLASSARPFVNMQALSV